MENNLNCDHDFEQRIDGHLVCSFCGEVAILSFASPKEETGFDRIDLLSLLIGIYEKGKKGNDINLEEVTDQVIDAVVDLKQLIKYTPASKEKPDFEKMARDYAIDNYSGTEMSDYVMSVVTYSGHALMKWIWNKHVEPQQEQIAALQEEIRQLKNKQ